MRADEQDRVFKTKPQSGTLVMWLFWVGLMSVLVLGFGYFKIDSKFLKSVEAEKPQFVNSAIQALEQSNSVQSVPSKPRQPAVESQSSKQTVFNDQNYQPKGLVNSIAPPARRHYEPSSARSSAQVRESARSFNAPITTRTVPWQWESVKTHRSGIFTYRQTRQGIDTMSVCKNYQAGSFIYRDCRKAAKKHFQEVCSNDFRAACAAAGMIP